MKKGILSSHLDMRLDLPQRWSPTTTTLTSLSSIVTNLLLNHISSKLGRLLATLGGESFSRWLSSILLKSQGLLAGTSAQCTTTPLPSNKRSISQTFRCFSSAFSLCLEVIMSPPHFHQISTCKISWMSQVFITQTYFRKFTHIVNTQQNLVVSFNVADTTVWGFLQINRPHLIIGFVHS